MVASNRTGPAGHPVNRSWSTGWRIVRGMVYLAGPLVVLAFGIELVDLVHRVRRLPSFGPAVGGFLLTAILTWLFRGPLMLFTVLVHELTHVFSALAFLGRPHSIEANASGNGLARLSVSMDNFFVLLAPYSVPLLALAWLPVRGLASESAMDLYGAVLGALLAWHTTSVLQSFRAYQSDLQLSGLLLSWLVCLAGNLVLVGFILATGLQGWRAGLSHMEAGLDRTSIIARSLVSSVPLARRTEQGRPLRPPARPSRVGGGWKELGGARMESTDVRR